MTELKSDGVKVRAFQHGGQKNSYGDSIKSRLIFKNVDEKGLKLTIYVGEERKAAIIVELDAASLAMALAQTHFESAART